MTVGEVVDILVKVDRQRMVYVPDCDGKAELAAAVVDLRHLNLPEEMKAISISDDVAIIPASMLDDEKLEDIYG